MNDHHGVGIKLGPYMRRQHGAALDTMARIKAALDPNGVMNPGKMGLEMSAPIAKREGDGWR